MNKISNVFVALILALLGVCNVSATGWESEYGGVMLQGFYWDSYTDTKWTNLTSQVDELSAYYDLIWIPNSAASGYGNSMGYNPKYWFMHDSSFGTSSELRKMIKEFKKKGTGFIADVVINHRDGVNDWYDFPAEIDHHGVTWQLGLDAICANDELAYAEGKPKPTGVNDEGENFDGCRDLDHTNAYVQEAIKAYLDYLLNELGYAGFRYDMVKGFAAYYVGLYNAAVKPTYSVGEYFDGNYDLVKGWIDGTIRDNEIQSGAFDFPMKYRMNEAFAYPSDFSKLVTYYNNSNQPNGMIKEPGFRRFSVTFVDNHDTYRDGSKFSNDSYVLAANAFIMCHPGTPCVFLPHWQQYKNEIKNLINVRKSVGIHNQSNVEVWVAQADKYVAKVYGKHGDLFIKVGYGDYTPDGFNSADIVASGEGYCVWSKVHIKNLDDKIIPANDRNGFSVYVEKSSVPASWSGLYCYAWVDESTRLTPVFPGDEVYKEVTVGGEEYYKFTFDAATVKSNLLFSDGNGMQTVDIAGVSADTYYRISSTDASGKYTVEKIEASGDETGEPITISLAKNSIPDNWGVVKFYAWDKNDNKPLGSWSGAEINAITTIAGKEYYTYTFPENITMVNVIFTDGSQQTVDIKGVERSTYYAIGEKAGDKYEVEELNVPGNGGISVYFEHNAVTKNWTTVNCYAWDSDDNKLLGDWPGTAMTDTVELYRSTYYVSTFGRDVKSVNVIFNNGQGQTADIVDIDKNTFFSIKDDFSYYQGTEAIFISLNKNSAAAWDKVYFYAWDADKNELLGQWPGTEIKTVMRAENNVEYYFYPFAPHYSSVNVVINDSLGNQTVDIEDITESTFFALNSTSGKTITVSTEATEVCTGVEDVISPDNTCLVYPNPCADYLYIANAQHIESVYIYNVEGRIVMQGAGSVLDLQALLPGIYFYNIVQADGTVNRGKFVKK